MVVVDSDILIRYLRGIPAAVQAVQNLAASDSLACSVVTTFEVLRGATPAQLPATEALLASPHLRNLTVLEGVPLPEPEGERFVSIVHVPFRMPGEPMLGPCA